MVYLWDVFLEVVPEPYLPQSMINVNNGHRTQLLAYNYIISLLEYSPEKTKPFLTNFYLTNYGVTFSSTSGTTDPI